MTMKVWSATQSQTSEEKVKWALGSTAVNKATECDGIPVELFKTLKDDAITVVSSVYLRLSKFLPAMLIPACTSSSLAFCMMYSAYKLNNQGDNLYSLDILLSQF